MSGSVTVTQKLQQHQQEHQQHHFESSFHLSTKSSVSHQSFSACKPAAVEVPEAFKQTSFKYSTWHFGIWCEVAQQ
ncbi:Tyrosine-protein kinase csk-1 [Dissostichus eleginoides]|uniref:Tyrosine-protein kinase csk-1 n=1 Tax=Dissostichus eleginoides TaxID=100907 RepID=A0AAD9B7C2_DISEL|nr:Tyrosine-protein kinase csk-1 [Dissostichus eleginoides]